MKNTTYTNFGFQRCPQNAFKNIHLYPDCKVRIGSMGFGRKPFWEYGGYNYNIKKFFDDGDFHCWIETKEGKVVDVFHYEYLMICRFRNVNVKIPKKQINKNYEISYQKLKKMGIHYMKVESKMEKIMLSILKKKYNL